MAKSHMIHRMLRMLIWRVHFVCIFQKWVAVGDEPAPAIWCAPANGLAITALLQHIESQHPPDKEYCDNCACEMNDPVASCFRTTEIEHGGIVAWGGGSPGRFGPSGIKTKRPKLFRVMGC